MTYFRDLNSFYRIFSPSDVYGKVSIKNPDGTTQSSADFSKFIYDNYLGRSVLGEKIISDLKPKNSSASSNFGQGYLYNTLVQKKNETSADVLHEDYWTHETYAASDEGFKLITPLQRGKNFYAEVCGVPPSSAGPAAPPVNFTINVIRSPQINPSVRNVSEIEFFLNHIPSVFASQMVPYFEVEFQLPRVANVAVDSTGAKTALLNRTSLLRFLLGTEIPLESLRTSEADRALVATIQDPITKKLNYFTGMEMFTTPQTLTNMDTLESRPGSVTRLNKVAPFLPPATLINGSIKMMNAGAGTFSRCMADVEFKLHDRKRLPEFAEFLRGPSGYGGTDPITVWLTYGWLAPRSRGEDDAYAKFINENMLVKRAFQFKNAGYSFDNAGQCSVKLELVSKGDLKAESQTLREQFDADTVGTIKMFKDAAEAAENLNNLLGNPAKGFGSEIRVFQVIDSTAAGQTGLDLQFDPNNPTDSATLSDFGKVAAVLGSFQAEIEKNNNIDPEKKARAKELLQKIRSAYDIGQVAKLRKKLIDYSKGRLKSCIDKNSPDPFLPCKKDIKSFNDGTNPPKPFFTDDLVKATEDRPGPSNTTQSGGNGKNVGRNHEPVIYWRNGKNTWVWHDTEVDLTQAEIDERKIGDQKSIMKGREESKRRSIGGLGVKKETPPKKALRRRRKGRMNIKIRRGKGGKILKYAAAATGSKKKGSKKTGPQQAEHKRSVVSFGKLFCSYCLPSILGGAADEDIDEVQVNFYQLNESCGPVSLHSIAEFPIDIDQFIQQYSEYFSRRGGDNVNLFEFLEFVSMNCFGDKRSPGYGMKSYYAAYEQKNPQPVAAGGKDEALQTKITGWFAKYGDFKQPSLTVSTEVIYANDAVNSKSDLLYQLASTVGPAYKGPRKGKKIIKRIHIYDATLDQYANLRKEVLRGDREYAVLSKELAERFGAYGGNPQATVDKNGINYGDIKMIGSGKDVLRDFLGYTVPTITYGANGTLITNASLASKMDGLMATAALMGGSQRASAKTTPNGLAMEEQSLPLRFLPAQLTLNSYGCPIAQLYQQYFFDFGTGTTLDNVYSATQINHSFSPGKFETSWTFVYSDGYGRFYNAGNLNPAIKSLVENLKPPSPSPPAGGNTTTAPK